MTNQVQCHDCGCSEGESHKLGCDMERCPFCGHQLITCSCCYKMLKLDCSPGTYTHAHGLTEKQEEQWEQMLKAKGRIPYIRWPNICARCGELWPEMFSVSDEEWKRYIEQAQRYVMVCRGCYDEIKALIDAGRRIVTADAATAPGPGAGAGGDGA